MDLFVKTFNELTIDELHDILQLRGDVFIVEQNCPYPDIDGKDKKALHVFLKDESGRIAAYTRCFNAGDYFTEASIGRVVVPIELRKYGYGHDIMKASIEAIETHYKTKTIILSGQTHLIKFYESHNFKTVGEEYLEDGIPHIKMVRQ